MKKVLFKKITCVLFVSSLFISCSKTSGGSSISEEQETQTFKVTWLNYDGSILETDNDVLAGMTPSYDGTTPVKPNNSDHYYIFDGWLPNILTVTQNATYTASFIEMDYIYHTVDFDSCDGSVVESKTIKHGEKISKPSNPTKEGSEFVCWTFNDNEWNFENDVVNENIVLTAKWELNKYTVTWLNYDGSILEKDEDVPYGTIPTYNGETPTKPNSTNRSYSFNGWSSEIIAVTQDITYTATFLEDYIYHTISFDSKDGSTIESQMIIDGETINKPQDPIKEGYTFKTWLFDNEPWDFENGIVTSDMTLEAVYDANQYQLLLAHYNDECHGTMTGEGTYTYNSSVVLNAVPDQGYVFSGWYKNEYKLISADATYVYTMGLDQTIYARWNAKLNNLVVISENEEMGTVSIVNGSGYSNESITVKAIANNGYSFVGWYNETLLLSNESVYSFVMPLNDYSIVARFVSNEVLLQRELGMIPVISNDHKTLTYGIYPQTVISDANLINRLNSLDEPEYNGWYKYENKYYAKATAQYSKKLSNGVTTTIGERYWFACEKINWTIISNSNNKYTVLCDVLYNGTYNELNDKKNDFFNLAFGLNNDCIEDSSKLFFLSIAQYKALPEATLACKIGDYSLATFTTSVGKDVYLSSTLFDSKSVDCVNVSGKETTTKNVLKTATVYYRFAAELIIGE